MKPHHRHDWLDAKGRKSVVDIMMNDDILLRLGISWNSLDKKKR